MLPSPRLAQVAAKPAQAGQHARHIAIEHGLRQAVCDAEHRRGSVPADSRQPQRSFEFAGKAAAVACHDLLRGAMQVARPAVIAQAGPQPQHLLGTRTRQRTESGEAAQETAVVRHDRRYSRLLEHDLGKPDAVRVAGAPPRQVALPAMKPAEQPAPEHGNFFCRKLPRLYAGEKHAPFSHITAAGFTLPGAFYSDSMNRKYDEFHRLVGIEPLGWLVRMILKMCVCSTSWERKPWAGSAACGWAKARWRSTS